MISLRKVTNENGAVLQNLFQFFCHELAVYDNTVPMKDGRYVLEGFHRYYTDPSLHSFLICAGESTVGFVVVSWSSKTRSHIVQHMFVLNGHRRQGIATAAMTAVFERFRGPYRVGQIANHQDSILFWKALYAKRRIDYQDAIEGEGLDKELVQRFVIE